MGIWEKPAATKKFVLLILGGAPASGGTRCTPPAYATESARIETYPLQVVDYSSVTV